MSTASALLLQRRCRSQRHRLQQIAHLPLILRKHPLQHRSASPRSSRDQHLLINRGSHRNDVRLFGQSVEQWTPILNPITLHPQQADMSRRPKQSLLKVLPEAVVDRKRYNQRCYSRRDTGNRDASDLADESLASFCAKITGGDEEFKAHGEKATSSQPSAFRHSGL